MSSRLPARLLTLALLLRRVGRVLMPRKPAAGVNRILVLHHLLLGDTIMLAPLLAKLRARHPQAELVMAMPRPFVPLFETRPYRVTPVAFDPRDPATIRAIATRWSAGFDIAYVPGDNRWSWLAKALGARWVVAHAGDRPAWKNWPVDEAIRFRDQPAAWGDMVADLAQGPAPAPFRVGDWPQPTAGEFERPSGPYAVLHVGASNPLRQWPDQNWRRLAAYLIAQGIEPVWSGGRGEQSIVAQIDPQSGHRSYAGQLDLPQLWSLLAGAELIVSPDTGVAHLARLTGSRSLTLFGQGSAQLFGRGDFWRDCLCAELIVDPFPCRDQRQLFKREIHWVRRCARRPGQCDEPRCMQALSVDMAVAQVDRLLQMARQATR